ncbi:hypothetical protein DEO45_01165 [Rhodanobacter denitrificans]|uniref:YcxB-like protein domain-containing protein n=1 Tax=Rhodanobacter denitrificans TaxID=666685 RepID=A0A368KHC0_9GAMM|nr:hypothetical protein DEO45_01165 [Rhodanobacter denitrificans]
MQVRYQYRCDVEYFRAVIDRQYRQGPWLFRLPVQFGVIGLACATAFAASADTSMASRAVLFVMILGLVAAVGVWATKQSLMMKFRRKPGFGAAVAVSISDAGVEVDGNQSWSKLEWSTYPAAVRFNDGILLKRPRSIRWLPDSAIVDGSAAEATELVASKTCLRHVR